VGSSHARVAPIKRHATIAIQSILAAALMPTSFGMGNKFEEEYSWSISAWDG
jgi:hypothetical protein